MADYTALHRYTGSLPGPVTDEMLQRAVDDAVEETADLDWKSERPPSKGLAQTDAPKDIAAMANSGGGVLVYGVTENGAGAAAGRMDVGEVSDLERREFTKMAARVIHPPVYGVQADQVGAPGQRALVVTVPASDAGPHLIYRNEIFGAPVRHGPDTIWMQEPQVAAAYRARFEAQREAREALTDLYEDATAHSRPLEMPWMYAVARPRQPRTSAVRPSRGDVGDWLNQAGDRAKVWLVDGPETPLDRVDKYNPRIGLRRWETPISHQRGSNQRWKQAWAGIHHDGAVVVAAAIGGRQTDSQEFASPPVIEIRSCEAVVAELCALVRIINEREHRSDYDVHIGIERTAPAVVTTTGQPLSFELDQETPQGHQRAAGATVKRFRPVTATLRHDLDDRDFLQQTCDIAEDVVNQAGFLYLARLVRDPPPSRLGRRY